jgi:hypothetical protein
VNWSRIRSSPDVEVAHGDVPTRIAREFLDAAADEGKI